MKRTSRVTRLRRAAVTVAALLLPTAFLAAPAQAATSCTVNGTAVPGPDVTGTDGDDVIVCTGLDAGATVDAKGGADTITLNGDVSGRVLGGDGTDHIVLAEGARLTGTGTIDGQAGRDEIDLRGAVLGAVRGGQDDDLILLFKTATTGDTSIVRGARGSDVILADGAVTIRGLVEGVGENDLIDINGTVAPTGRVHGGDGDDYLHVHDNQGEVDGGAGTDVCVVDSGNQPLNCP
ncbi:hypothetical protein [Streptomyces sp. UNOB3_S3]|uniref:hypothetical protein n=1 Tax=Streptomyces sp. UNOB3_S3 TaxID=2871682 RepID=UPI001E28A5C0|nr:hypothetical protein [Streptomyces sp. UNOB3_S3]MCC3779575.1 hypothetical protein [Streptomyces sp. UNOB3_S3]